MFFKKSKLKAAMSVEVKLETHRSFFWVEQIAEYNLIRFVDRVILC